jgi:hypothetical protein
MFSQKQEYKLSHLKFRLPITQLMSYYEAKETIKLSEQKLKAKLTRFEETHFTPLESKKLYSEFSNSIFPIISTYKTQMSQSLRERIRSHAINLQNKQKDYELFKMLEFKYFPENKLPANGITLIPMKYHKSKVEKLHPGDSPFGDPPHEIITDLIIKKYPRFKNVLYTYCRPAPTSEAVFADFNREQIHSQPSKPERLNDIQELIHYFLNTTPYRPVYYDDYIFCKMPLITGTGYYNKHSFDARAHAKYSHPTLYKDYPLSKGFYINYTFLSCKQIIHHIKTHGVPWKVQTQPSTTDGWKAFARLLNIFFLNRPTSLYVRIHISKRTAELKIRPVYGVDDCFLIIETMLTFPLLVQARHPDCAILHSYETLRGSNSQLDKLAQGYRSFFTLDYTRYDQSLPFTISDTYFETFLPKLIIFNKGYQPTITSPESTEKHDPDLLYIKMRNLLQFYHTWFRNMVFVTPEGYAYRRQHAGIPSGMLNTQQLDSYGNLYLICDALLEYGLTKRQIKQIRMFVLGDDNAGFTHFDIFELEAILQFAIQYIKIRWNMTIKPEKCVFTDNRQYISTLSYQCCFGNPKKDIEKLIAHLCFPEHGTKPQFMSSRAVGMAYAACGQDKAFHSLCEDVYNEFLPYAQQPKENDVTMKGKFLPGVFFQLENRDQFIDTTHFPTINEVHLQVLKWKGPLEYDSKWDSSHFINPPNHQDSDGISLFDYAQQIGDDLSSPLILA